MALYKYIKEKPKTISYKYNNPFGKKASAYLFMFLGAGILIWIMWPILSFMAFIAPELVKTVSPIDSKVQNVLSAQQKVTDKIDYTNPNSWYPDKQQKLLTSNGLNYSLSIPKLKINKARVVVAGDDLSKSLIQYGGTPLPGTVGNSVIFGHSTLVQFFNPKDYKTIFATLPSMKKGDVFNIDFNGLNYNYMVEDINITDPSDFSALENITDASYVTLITCVPPGTYYKRLNVKAKLMPL